MNLPTETELYALHQKICPKQSASLLEMVWTHSVIVKEIALLIVSYLESNHIEVNRQLVIVGALVHDIGVYTCLDNADHEIQPYIRHGIEGEQILLKEGYENCIARFASHHTGVGITSEDIEKSDLPLPNGDWIPVTLEEEIVSYADKFHSKIPRFNTYESQEASLQKHDPDNRVKLKNLQKKFGIPDLAELQKQYKKWEKEFKWGKQ